MTCQVIRDLLMTDYIDGRMNQKERSILESHLEACQECRQVYTTLRKAEGALSATPTLEPDTRVWEVIQERVAAKENPWWMAFPTVWENVSFRPALSLSAALAIAVIVGGVLFSALVIRQQIARNSADGASLLAFLEEEEDRPVSFEDSEQETVVEYFFGITGTFPG